MTLLDRFRTQPRQKHPDPAVRLAYVTELPLSERDLIVAAARGGRQTAGLVCISRYRSR